MTAVISGDFQPYLAENTSSGAERKAEKMASGASGEANPHQHQNVRGASLLDWILRADCCSPPA